MLFAPRCPIATAECRATEPGLLPINDKHQAACIRSTEISHGELHGAPIFPTPPVHEGALTRIPRDKRACVLSVSDLTKTFPLVKGALLKRTVGEVRAVNGLTFDIKEGECFAIVGESGCGKTTTLLEIMDLAPQAPTQIRLGEQDVTGISKHQRRLLRKDIQIVFQDPMGALDPRLTVAEILREPLDALGWDGDKNERIRELIQLVGLNPAHIDRFPGHFSGGQRQRISLARALAANPKLIVLDEPVSALDVSVQAGMLNLLDELKARLGISYLFVAHDLSVIRHISDRAAVMYLGRFVEQGDTDSLFDNPQHPYTKALLSAIPLADPIAERNRRRIILTDSQPSPTEEITGCAFRGRCPLYATLGDAHQRRCRDEEPEVRRIDNSEHSDHLHACHFAGTPLN